MESYSDLNKLFKTFIFIQMFNIPLHPVKINIFGKIKPKKYNVDNIIKNCF